MRAPHRVGPALAAPLAPGLCPGPEGCPVLALSPSGTLVSPDLSPSPHPH